MQFHRSGDQWFFTQQVEIPKAWDAIVRCQGQDYSHLTKTQLGRQWRPNYLADIEIMLRRWCNPCLRQLDLPSLGARSDTWIITYQQGGYQEFHAHGRGLITQVLYFRDDLSRTEIEIDKETLSVESQRGQLLTMSGMTKHRGTAVVGEKSVLVVDWQI